MTCIVSSILQPQLQRSHMWRRCYNKGLSAHFLKQYLGLENTAAEVVASQNAPVESGRVSTDCAILVPRSLLALPTFSALRISELLNIAMLFSYKCNLPVPQRLLARSFGQTARPKASPKCLQDSRPRPAFFTQMLEGFGPRPTWLSTDSGDRDQNAFPHVLARPNIFSPKYWRDSEARRCASPHIFYTGWIQEALLKG